MTLNQNNLQLQHPSSQHMKYKFNSFIHLSLMIQFEKQKVLSSSGFSFYCLRINNQIMLTFCTSGWKLNWWLMWKHTSCGITLTLILYISKNIMKNIIKDLALCIYFFLFDFSTGTFYWYVYIYFILFDSSFFLFSTFSSNLLF